MIAYFQIFRKKNKNIALLQKRSLNICSAFKALNSGIARSTATASVKIVSVIEEKYFLIVPVSKVKMKKKNPE